MKIETLKTLITKVLDTHKDGETIKKEILALLELYIEDNKNPFEDISPKSIPVHPWNPNTTPNWPWGEIKAPYDPNIIVTYGDLCSCNPKNGGSGICGCTIGNKIVRGPGAGQNTITWSTNTTATFTENDDDVNVNANYAKTQTPGNS